MTTPLLQVRNLRVALSSGRPIVDDISFELQQREVFGIAGESGSGKTMTALAVMRLLPKHACIEGDIIFDDTSLLSLKSGKLRRFRGNDIAMAFQEPLSALHPMLTVERQLTEHVRLHTGANRAAARQRAVALLDEVRMPDPEATLRGYPHQFSGGMRQRIQIAMALACEPRLLIADEPTTALDVTVQAGLLHLLDSLRQRRGLAVILITHDLGVLSALADSVTVMYAGRVVESGRTSSVIGAPRHPYTQGLIASLPHAASSPGEALIPIPGVAADAANRPAGCAFHPRCRFATSTCGVNDPPLVPVGDGRTLACIVDPFAPPIARSAS